MPKLNLQPNTGGGYRVISNFDIEAFRKARAPKKSGNKLADLEATLNEIDGRIATLKVGSALAVPIDKEKTMRQNIMRVRAPLTNITMKGRAWAGRSYEVVGDEDNEVVLVYRGEDLKEAKERAPSTRGQKDETPAPSEEAAVTTH